jgi:membrane-bound lytic murein transglycosylase D
MTRLRRWWLPLAAAFLSACSTLPSPTTGEATSGDATAASADAERRPDGSRFALRAPRVGGPSIPAGPLSELPVANVAAARAVTPLDAPKDLWERIRRGFAMPDLDNDLVRDKEQWYSARPDYLVRMTERGSKYLFHIVEELERRNMPTELALLPFVESAFNPQAVSSARAAGMWQFMPATGKDFDLKQNMFRDDRRDVLASTRAALDLLERLYRQFGDWHLALAAYNWGPGNVNKMVRRNRAAGQAAGYGDIQMPAETRHYVPKLQALENIVAEPARFRTQLPLIGNHPFFDAVPIKRDIDVAKVAELAGVSEQELRQLNPSANKPVILAAGTPTVLLPWDYAAAFEARLATHTGPLSNWTAWVAPHDMSLAQAAAQHDVSEQELRQINAIPPRMRIRGGSTLLVPRAPHVERDVPGHLADHAQLLLQQEVQLVKRMVKALKGDTVARLAGRHRVSATSVADWNDLRENAVLKAGQSVVLYLPQRAASVGASRAGGERKQAIVPPRSSAGKVEARPRKSPPPRKSR